MRVPTQAPALARNHRSRVVRRFGSSRAHGWFPHSTTGARKDRQETKGKKAARAARVARKAIPAWSRSNCHRIPPGSWLRS